MVVADATQKMIKFCRGNFHDIAHMPDRIINLVAAISEQIGRITVLSHGNLNPHTSLCRRQWPHGQNVTQPAPRSME